MSTETFDPLDLLRDYICKGGSIIYDKKGESGQLMFENFENSTIRLPLSTQTAWKKQGGNDFHNLGSIWCAVNHRQLKAGEQQRKYHEIGVPTINPLEAKELVAYFTGVISDSNMIDIQSRTQTLISKNDLRRHGGGQPDQSKSGQKKRELKLNEKLTLRIEEEKKMSVNDFLLQNEIKLQNRSSVMQSPHVNFLKVLHLGFDRIELKGKDQKIEWVQEKVRQFQDQEKRFKQDALHNPILAGSNVDIFKKSVRLADMVINKAAQKQSILKEIQKHYGSIQGGGRPIIIVPGTNYPGNLSMKNAIQFLRDGKYVDQNQIKQGEAEKNEKFKVFEKRIGQEKVSFEVYDSVFGFTSKEWRRVVCLFSCGELFQLKDFPPKDGDEGFNGTDQDVHLKIVNIFHRVKGFYFHYQDIPEPAIVKKWNVSRVVIERNKRYHDINVSNKIWKEIELFLKKEKFKGQGVKF